MKSRKLPASERQQALKFLIHVCISTPLPYLHPHTKSKPQFLGDIAQPRKSIALFPPIDIENTYHELSSPHRGLRRWCQQHHSLLQRLPHQPPRSLGYLHPQRHSRPSPQRQHHLRQLPRLGECPCRFHQ